MRPALLICADSHGIRSSRVIERHPFQPGDRAAVRLSDLIEFAVNLGHAGDILGRMVSREHLARLGGRDPAAPGVSTLLLSTLRDLKLVNSYLASIGYASLDPTTGQVHRFG